MDDLPFDEEFIATFRAEAQERLANLSSGLLAIESTAPDEESLKNLFREAHTLKGSAGMMGLDSIKELAHRIEDILGSVQKGQQKIDQRLTDLLLETIDRIDALLPDGGTADREVKGISDLIERLGESIDAPGEADDSSATGDQPRKEREDVPVKDDEPANVVTLSADHPAAPKDTDATIRVNIDRLDKLLNLMGEILVNQTGTRGQVQDLSLVQGRSRELKQLFDAVSSQVRDMHEKATPEQIEQLIQKLNIAQSMASEMVSSLDRAASDLKEKTATHTLALKELHDSTLHVRMLPLSTIFSLYPRVARDAARSCDKEVVLKIRGEKTELDKRILEQITDPLLHIIRNCVDHGIEAPAVREAAGKPEKGVISISADQRGDVVDISIEDDGAGIDLERVRQVAVEHGLISRDDDISGEEAFSLIFRPGFSTANEVSEVSGRGVGMDVVKNNIEKLDGAVSIESVPGEGTKLTVSIPLTMVVITGLIVEAGGSRYVIPISSVQEMASLEPGDVQTLGNHRSFLMRGKAVPIVDLVDVLGGTYREREGKVNVIIVRSGCQWLGLEVDGLLGEREVVIKPLGPFLAQHPFVSGASILSEGEIVVVLNVLEMLGVLQDGDEIIGPGRQEVLRDGRGEAAKAVLVVEDSLVVRELQKNILEAAGYKVDTAVDGKDALLHLKKAPVDCVVTDIEMPGMDGFDLTAAIKKSEQLCGMPVVMVTSLGSEDDKRRGIEVGADAYVIKGSFDQHNLLETIERLVA